MHWEGTAKPVLLAAAAALKGFSYVISNDLGSFCNCHHRVALPPFPMSHEWGAEQLPRQTPWLQTDCFASALAEWAGAGVKAASSICE